MSETKTYAFEAGVIRLTEPDLNKWKRAFPHVSVEAELWSLSDWASRQKNWFVAVSSALAKRERQATTAMHTPVPKAEHHDRSF